MKARLPKGMGGGPQNMQSMLKQAQKMQEDMAALQAELEEREYDVAAGGGVINVKINGKKEILSVLPRWRIIRVLLNSLSGGRIG